MATKLFYFLLGLFLFLDLGLKTGNATLQPRAPNFQYFERPKYRYPYYDSNGKGKLLYGYGGPELYQYKSYSPLEVTVTIDDQETTRETCGPTGCGPNWIKCELSK